VTTRTNATKAFYPTGECVECGVRIPSGGPNGEPQGWRRLHADWHAALGDVRALAAEPAPQWT